MSFHHLNDGFDNKKLQEKIDHDVIMLPDDYNAIKLYNIKYRLSNWSSQDWIYHNIIDCKDLRTVKYKGKRYVECKPHSCHMTPLCKDGVRCNGSQPCSGIHDNLFFQDDKGMYHLEPEEPTNPSMIDGDVVKYVGQKWIKRYYRKNIK